MASVAQIDDEAIITWTFTHPDSDESSDEDLIDCRVTIFIGEQPTLVDEEVTVYNDWAGLSAALIQLDHYYIIDLDDILTRRQTVVG